MLRTPAAATSTCGSLLVVAVAEDLQFPCVRGRLRFEATAVSANGALAACEFADFLPDIAENRILCAGLELLATQRLFPGLRLSGAPRATPPAGPVDQ